MVRWLMTQLVSGTCRTKYIQLYIIQGIYIFVHNKSTAQCLMFSRTTTCSHPTDDDNHCQVISVLRTLCVRFRRNYQNVNQRLLYMIKARREILGRDCGGGGGVGQYLHHFHCWDLFSRLQMARKCKINSKTFT